MLSLSTRCESSSPRRRPSHSVPADAHRKRVRGRDRERRLRDGLPGLSKRVLQVPRRSVRVREGSGVVQGPRDREEHRSANALRDGGARYVLDGGESAPGVQRHS